MSAPQGQPSGDPPKSRDSAGDRLTTPASRLRSPLDFRKLFAKARDHEPATVRLRSFPPLPPAIGQPARGGDRRVTAPVQPDTVGAPSVSARRPSQQSATTVGSAPPDPVRCEHRAVPRRPSGAKVTVCRIREASNVTDCPSWRFQSSPLRGELIDVSLDGALVALGPLPTNMHPLSPGERIALRMRQPLRAPIDAAATVLRTSTEPDGGCKIACRFAHRLPLHQVMQIAKQLFRSTVV